MAIDRFRYGLVYVVHEEHAHVVAFAHSRRRPRYWIDRVD